METKRMTSEELKEILQNEGITKIEPIKGKKYSYLFPKPSPIHTFTESFTLYNNRYLCSTQNITDALSGEKKLYTRVIDIKE